MQILNIVKSLLKQLIIVGIVITISIAIMSVNQATGIIAMMLFSSVMVIKSAYTEIPLNKFTALLPGIMSIIIFFFILILFDVENEMMPLIGIGLGIIIGWLMSRGHDVYIKNGILYAKRTFFYVFIWILSILFTQGSTLLGMKGVTNFGLLLNGFSTAMMVVLSIILFFKTTKKNKLKANSSLVSVLFLVTMIVFALPQTSNAATVHCAPNNEICCFAHTFGGDNPNPAKFEICLAQGMSFNVKQNAGFSFPTDEIDAAGIITAILLLLTSLGLNASISAVQGVASSVESVAQEASSNTETKEGFVRGTKMLQGTEADKWMKDHGYIKDEERPHLYQKNKLEEFKNSLPTHKSSGLQAWAGEPNKEGNMVGDDYVILVDDEYVEIPQHNDDIDENNDSKDTDNSTKTNDINDEKSSDETKLDDKKNTPSVNGNDGSNDTDTDNKKTSDTSTQKTTKKVNKSPSTTPKDESPPIDYSNVKEKLEKVMDKIIKDKTAEGYYVRNSHTLQDSFEAAHKRNPDVFKWEVLYHMGWIMESGWKGINNVGELPAYLHEDLAWLTWHPVDYFFEWKGGQCGEYAEHGAEWSKNNIYDQYGRGTKIDKIIIKSNVSDSANHAATRITLPNGEKYILDYWEGMQNNRSAVYKEKEWIDTYKKDYNLKNKGTKVEYEYSNKVNNEQHNSHLLKQRIDRYGVNEGKKRFLDFIKKNNTIDLPNAQKIVAAWEKRPW